MDSSIIQVKIGFVAADWKQDEREVAAQNLLRLLKGLDGLESVERVFALAPEGSKAGVLGILPGLLMAQVNKENVQKLFGFLGNRLSGKTIEFEVEANGKKLKVKASSQAEMDIAIAAALKFITN
jgi:hypothetical protein